MRLDTRDRRTERWVRQMTAAIRLNASNLDLWERAFDDIDPNTATEYPRAFLARSTDHVFAFVPRDAAQAAEDAALAIRTPESALHLRYRFEGQKHRVYEIEAARRRGFGACADASAALAAVVLMTGGECAICYERAPPLAGYAHVRVAIGDTFVDAFPEQSLEVEACSALLPVTRESVRWPATAAETAMRLLAARRLAAIPPSSPAGSTI